MLKDGDVFELCVGHTVYMDLPEHFCYENREGVFDRLSKTEVVVGEPKGGMPTDWLAGRYVVTSTSMSGGGTGHGPHDVYPDGHLVWAEKLQATDFDHRVKVSFYQSGSFTAMNPDITATGRATATWNEA